MVTFLPEKVPAGHLGILFFFDPDFFPVFFTAIFQGSFFPVIFRKTFS